MNFRTCLIDNATVVLRTMASAKLFMQEARISRHNFRKRSVWAFWRSSDFFIVFFNPCLLRDASAHTIMSCVGGLQSEKSAYEDEKL